MGTAGGGSWQRGAGLASAGTGGSGAELWGWDVGSTAGCRVPPGGGVSSRCGAGAEHLSEMLTEKEAFALVSSICLISSVVNRTRCGENHGNLTPTMGEIGLRRKLVGLTGK